MVRGVPWYAFFAGVWSVQKDDYRHFYKTYERRLNPVYQALNTIFTANCPKMAPRNYENPNKLKNKKRKKITIKNKKTLSSPLP